MNEVISRNTVPAMGNEFLTIREVKDYLKISQSAAYGLTHSKGFPVARFGASVRIPRKAFLAWVDMQTVIPGGLADYINSAEGRVS